MKKRWLAMVMTVIMVFTSMPLNLFALDAFDELVEEAPAAVEEMDQVQAPDAEQVEETSEADMSAEAEEPLETEELAEAEELPEAEELAEVEETPAAEELAEGEEAPEAEELAEVEETPAAEELAEGEEAPANEELSEGEEPAEEIIDPEEFVLTAEADSIIVTLTAEAGAFGDVKPEDTVLSVRKIEDAAEAEMIEEAVSENRSENVNPVSSYKFDITVLDKDGNELQPAEGAAVRVSFALAEVVDSNLNVSVYHVKEEQSEALTAEELEAEEEIITEDERGDETVITIETDGFSYYVVEFTYGNLEYVLPGDSSVLLARILTSLGLSGSIEAAEVSAPELFIAEKNESDLWVVTALQPFTSEEWLKVTVDGVEYTIVVTDGIAPGTRQQITKEELEDGIFLAYHAVENGVKLTLYCFNSELAWPVTGNPDLTDYYVPDEMLSLSDAVKDKIYRILYAGYPHNNLGLYSTGDEPIGYGDLADAILPPQALKDLLPEYDWDNLSFTPENLVASTPESSVMDELLWSMLDDDCYGAILSKPDFMSFLAAWQFGPYPTVDDLLEAYASMKPTSSPGDVHDATQIAIWRILYENGVQNNGKPMTEELVQYPLAKQLVDFANGVGEYKDAPIPARGTTIAQMEEYKVGFNGSKLLRAGDTPVGSGKIVFTENDDGIYVSEPLHFAHGTYALPYTITLSDGTDMVTSVINYGTGEFVLYSPSKPTNGQVTIETENMFPSDVYQYVVESQKDISASELSHDANHVQDMSGVYYQSVPMALSFDTEFRDAAKTGNLKVSKTVTGADAGKNGVFNFTVELSDTSINGTYGSMTFENGVAAFTLKDGETKEAKNLPVDITYTVSEDDYSSVGYTTSSTNETGTITKNETAEVPFTNAYNAKSVSVSLSGTKTLTGTGKTLKNEEFSFTIEGSRDGVTKTVKNDAAGKIDFGTHEFTEPGEYKYLVKEVLPENPEAGVTYDTNEYDITVTVTDDGTGQLKAELLVSDRVSGIDQTITDGKFTGLDFNNEYKAGSTSVVFGGEKEFVGFPADSAIESEFTFVLKEGSAELDRKSIRFGKGDTHGEFEFAGITYTEAGEHTYTVNEVKGTQPGVNYDTKTYTIKVSVTDNGKGQLVAAISGNGFTTGNDLKFGNSYKAASVDVQFSGTKTLVGRALAADEFSFTLTGEDGRTETVKNGADGTISFTKLSFNKAGVYKYTVREDASDEAGITIDSKIYNITVTVTDSGNGQLTAAITGDTTTGTNLNFTNKYVANSTSVVLGGTKTFNGFPEDSTIKPVFRFTLSENGRLINGKTVNGSGDYEFDSITYTEAGKHTYTIREITGSQAGVIYSEKTYNVAVTVTDNGEGQLVAAISGDSETGKDLNFINSYKAAPVELRLKGTKTLTVPTGSDKVLTEGEFSFTITGSKDGVSRTVKNSADGTIDFGAHEFTEAGVYEYTVKEENTGEAGVTYDSTIYNFSVVVTDSGNGKLAAELKGGITTGSDIHFTNKYEPGSTSVTLGGKKIFSGFPEDSSIKPVFTFTLSEGGTVIDTQTVTNSGEYDFKSITYTGTGVHTYTVKETAGDQAGVTYDSQVYEVIVTVTDDGHGQLHAAISGGSTTGDDLDFENSYQAAPVKLHITGTKTLTGKTLEDKEFSFTITGQDDGLSLTKYNDASGNIDFGEHSFDKAGEYRYTVKENNTGEPGVTYDSKIYNFTVLVTDSGSGQLAVDVKGDIKTGSDIHFTNSYAAGSTSVTFSGTKIFEGFPEDSTIEPEFTFVLKEDGTEIDRRTVKVRGDYSFGSITYDSITYNTVGSHDYTVEELKGGQLGVTYDEEVYKLHVDVVDKGGQLAATISGSSTTGDDIDFINSYEAAPVDVLLSGTKTLEGRALAADEFSFTLTGEDGTSETVKNTKEGKISFTKLHFTKAGVYNYTVKEEPTTEAGVTIDGKIYHITVTVTDSGNGQLAAAISGDTTTGSDLNFANKYVANSTSVVLGGTKTFNGFPEDSSIKPVFTFTLSEGAAVIDTQTVTKSGEYDFKSITYTAAGVHNYTVKESVGDQAGVTYDSETYEVTVTVTDNGEGQLVAAISGESTTGQDLNFINGYKAEAAELHLRGTKTLTVPAGNGKVLADKEFSFTITGLDDGLDLTVYNDASGNIDFGKHSFDKAGTYRYTVKENNTGEAGVTYDSTIYNFSVVVTDSGNGKLKAAVEGGIKTGSDIHFTNKYEPGSTSVTFSGTKNFNGFPEDSAIEPVFTFVLKEGGVELERKSVKISGDYSFSSITYDSITYAEAGSHDYTIEEIAGDQAGVTYDKKVYKIHVDVKDVDGQLQASISGGSTTGDDLDFTNSYKAAPADLHLRGTKTLEDPTGSGRTLQDKEFSFTITGVDDGLSLTVENDAYGNIDFGKHSFDKAGEYRYTVKENAAEKDGITYDSKIYSFTVSVTDSGNGKLKAAVEGGIKTGSDIRFTNTYIPKSTSIILGGTKSFEGFPEDSGIEPVFTFTISEDSTVLDTQTVTRSGEYEFKSITYTEAGDHTYTVKETAGTQAGIVYDGTTYTVKVSVTDDGSGQLAAAISGDSTTGKDLNFTNKYEPAAASIRLSGMKTLEGRDLAENEFSFILSEDGIPVETVKNGADGSISFSKLSFTKAGVYNYTVEEKAVSDSSIITDSHVYNVSVTVSDSGSGHLTAVLGGDTATGSDLYFTNVYSPKYAPAAALQIPVKKVVKGTDPDGDKTFSFTLKPVTSGAPTPAGGKTVTIVGSGSNTFGLITFTGSGTYEYELSEVKGSEPGYTYDSTVYTVTVKVRGGEASYTVSGGGEAVFTNIYETEGASVIIPVRKVVKGEVPEGEDKTFVFDLAAETAGAPMPGESSVTITGTGFAAFDAIEFTEEGVYSYSISERNTAEENYAYDNTVYTVTVTVTEKEGKLYANVAVSGGEAVFTNVYVEDGVVVVEETVTPDKPTEVPVVTSPEDKPTGEYFIDENGVPRAIYVNEFGEEYYIDDEGVPRAVWYLPKTGYGPSHDWLLVGIGNLALIVMIAAMRKKKKSQAK